MRGDITKASFVDVSEISKSIGIVDLVRLCPRGKAIALPKSEFSLTNSEKGGLIGTIARYTGKKVSFKEDVKTYYIVTSDESPSARLEKVIPKKAKAKRIARFENGAPILYTLPQPEYMDFLEEKIARYGSVVISKKAFKTGKSRVYAARELRKLGYLVDGTMAPQVKTIKVTGPKGAHTYTKHHGSPTWFFAGKDEATTTPEQTTTQPVVENEMPPIVSEAQQQTSEAVAA